MKFEKNRLLSEFTTFGIGGPIHFFIEVHTIEEVKKSLFFAQKEGLPFLILGKGSNSLFSDEGFPGLVMLNKIDFIEWGELEVRVGSGYSFSLLGGQTARKGWAGLEFASGIPASVGGALFMNAGANGSTTSDCLEKLVFLLPSGEEKTYNKHELSFGYRTSSFQHWPGMIVEATFILHLHPEARQKQLQIIETRCKTQPLKEKSAGCIFRNPSQTSAGRLIEQAGLKGRQIGGARVSEVHANFIVNVGGATAQDVQALMAEVQATVKDKTGIELEPEVRIL